MDNLKEEKEKVEKLKKQKKRLLKDIDFLNESFQDIEDMLDKRRLEVVSEDSLREIVFISLGEVSGLFNKSGCNNQELNQIGKIGNQLLSKIYGK